MILTSSGTQSLDISIIGIVLDFISSSESNSTAHKLVWYKCHLLPFQYSLDHRKSDQQQNQDDMAEILGRVTV